MQSQQTLSSLRKRQPVHSAFSLNLGSPTSPRRSAEVFLMHLIRLRARPPTFPLRCPPPPPRSHRGILQQFLVAGAQRLCRPMTQRWLPQTESDPIGHRNWPMLAHTPPDGLPPQQPSIRLRMSSIATQVKVGISAWGEGEERVPRRNHMAMLDVDPLR